MLKKLQMCGQRWQRRRVDMQTRTVEHGVIVYIQTLSLFILSLVCSCPLVG